MGLFIPRVINIKDQGINDIRIDRATPWGNPFIIGVHGDSREEVVMKHLSWLNEWCEDSIVTLKRIGIREYSNRWVIENIKQLKGKNLVCWCAPEACHGDILLMLANQR